MYSQTSRYFSQGGELSQLSGQESTNHDENYSTQQQRVESNDYNSPSNSEINEPLSTRADAICEQNRQIRGFVQKSLKQIEKKRLKLYNKKSELKEQIRMCLEKRKRLSQQSVNLQMQIEQTAEQYHCELNERENLKDKLNNTQKFVDYFVQHYAEIPKITKDLEMSEKDLKSEFEKLSTDLKDINNRKNEFVSSCQLKMNEILQSAKETRAVLINQRKLGVEKIQTLVIRKDENLRKIDGVQGEIPLLMDKRTQLNNLYDQLIIQNKLMKETSVKRHQEVEELNATSARDIQNIKLRINNEENKNSNLQVRFEENDNRLNLLSKKENELINLYNQMNGAIETSLKKKEDLQKKIDECTEKRQVICNEIKVLQEQINQYENSYTTNEFLKSEIIRLQENIKEKNLLEIQDSLKEISNEEVQLNKVYEEITCDVHQFNDELVNLIPYQKKLNEQLNKNKSNNQHERNVKSMENKHLTQLNLDYAANVKTLKFDHEEAKNLKNKLEMDKLQMSTQIVQYKEREEEIKNKLNINKSEWADKCNVFNKSIELKNNTLDKIEELIIEAKPRQAELRKLLDTKAELDDNIKLQKANYYKEKECLENNHNSKLKELSGEIAKYTSIMDGIISAEVEAIEKLKEEIRQMDSERRNQEASLNKVFLQLAYFKKEEQSKRIHVTKLEKRLKTINQEIKITNQDISDAITGNSQKPMKASSSTNRTHSLHESLHQEPPIKKMTFPSSFHDPNFKQMKTKQRVETFYPEDERDFSDV